MKEREIKLKKLQAEVLRNKPVVINKPLVDVFIKVNGKECF